MIAKKYRLSAAEFFTRGSSSFFAGALKARARRNEKGRNRFAVVIGARAEKTSVRRHFWKRLIYDAVIRWPNRGCDVIITATDTIATTPPAQVRRQLGHLAQQFSSRNP